jgi:DNA-binding transcriptional regulator YhcF (GntR family)
MSLAGSQIAPLNKKEKQELVATAVQQLGKFGASKEQAHELVEMIVKEINSQAKKHPGNDKNR